MGNGEDRRKILTGDNVYFIKNRRETPLQGMRRANSPMSRWGMIRLWTKDSFSYLNYPRIQSEMVRETSGHRR